MELEARFEQPAWRNAAALDYQFGLGPVNKGRDLQHPARRWQSKRYAKLPTYDSHHLPLRNLVRRGQVDRPAEIVPVDQPFDSAAKIGFVNPRNILTPAGNGASQPPSREASQDPVNTTFARGEDHSGAQSDLPCRRSRRLEERFFPSTGDLNRERILRLRSRTNFAGGLIHLPVECVFVDGGCAGIKPDRRRFAATSDCLAQHARRIDSRLQNLPPVAIVVPAIHRSPSEID